MRGYEPRIKIAGVGGAGIKVVNRIIDAGWSGIEFISIDFDLAALRQCKATVNLKLESLYPGLTFPEFGNPARMRNRESAVAGREQIRKVLSEAEVVFVIAGMGGDMGSGVAPVVSQTASETGALTIGVVTLPFRFEGQSRTGVAEAGINDLCRHTDTLVVIPNERILPMVDTQRTSVTQVFELSDDIVREAVQCIIDNITLDCLGNRLDCSDVGAILVTRKDEALTGMLGIGYAHGPNRAVDAAHMAMSSPLLEKPIADACSVLINVSSIPNVTPTEVVKLMKTIRKGTNPHAKILNSVHIGDRLKAEICIVILCLYE